MSQLTVLQSSQKNIYTRADCQRKRRRKLIAASMIKVDIRKGGKEVRGDAGHSSLTACGHKNMKFGETKCVICICCRHLFVAQYMNSESDSFLIKD